MYDHSSSILRFYLVVISNQYRELSEKLDWGLMYESARTPIHCRIEKGRQSDGPPLMQLAGG